MESRLQEASTQDSNSQTVNIENVSTHSFFTTVSGKQLSDLPTHQLMYIADKNEDIRIECYRIVLQRKSANYYIGIICHAIEMNPKLYLEKLTKEEIVEAYKIYAEVFGSIGAEKIMPLLLIGKNQESISKIISEMVEIILDYPERLKDEPELARLRLIYTISPFIDEETAEKFYKIVTLSFLDNETILDLLGRCLERLMSKFSKNKKDDLLSKLKMALPNPDREDILRNMSRVKLWQALFFSRNTNFLSDEDTITLLEMVVKYVYTTKFCDEHYIYLIHTIFYKSNHQLQEKIKDYLLKVRPDTHAWSASAALNVIPPDAVSSKELNDFLVRCMTSLQKANLSDYSKKISQIYWHTW